MDVRQGTVGNCWFMAAASALAEKPQRLEKIFLNNSPELNKQGIYGVNLYSLGVQQTVIVDDFLPLKEAQQEDGSVAWDTMFGHVGSDSSIWGPILEKALAKVHGNYHHIAEGNPREATLTLAGSPSDYQVHNRVSMEQIWSSLVEHDSNDDLIFFNTPVWPDGAATNACGLATGHTYVVLSAVQLSNGARLVKLRNPWGKELYSCAYSDNSQRWTPELRREAGATEKAEDDGVFFMKIEDYYRYGLVTVISYDTTSWSEDHFLMFDD